MESALEEFYFNEIKLKKRAIRHRDQYQKALNLAAENEKKLLYTLDGEERQLLVELINAYDEMSGILSLNGFIEGYYHGAGTDRMDQNGR